MKKDFELSQHDFENLLNWLSDDRETAGEKYEQIRTGLIRFFRFRGCQDPAFLADETINRVAVRVTRFDHEAKAKIVSVFYGFASKIFLENVSHNKKKEVQLELNLQFEDPKPVHLNDSEEIAYECLESCLRKLRPDENKMVITYYSKDRSAGFAVRKDLAESLNMKVGTLHTRVCRIRNVLRVCVEECIREK